jgi:hypothetical protein
MTIFNFNLFLCKIVKIGETTDCPTFNGLFDFC